MSSSEFDGFQQFPGRYTLNRSASFSEMPVRKRIIIEECVIPSSAGTTIFRQFSCEEVRHSPAKYEPEIGLSIFRHCTSELYIPKYTKEESRIKNLSIKPHHIVAPKLLALKGNKANITNPQSAKQSEDKAVVGSELMPDRTIEVQDKETLVRSKLQRINKMKDSLVKQSNIWMFFTVLAFCMLLFLFFILEVSYDNYCHLPFKINEMKTIMNSKLFGQAAAVKDVVSALETFFYSDETGLKLLVLAGTTGVGKSYLVSLLEEQFPWKTNIHHWVMPITSEDLELRTRSRFTTCGSNLVVVDSLSKEDVSEAIQLAKFLTVIGKQKRILAIFAFSLPLSLTEELNTNVTEESLLLNSKFDRAGIDTSPITFQPLEKQHVISCIEAALARSRYPYSNRRVDRILEELNHLQDGCKRVQSKVPLHVEIHKTDL